MADTDVKQLNEFIWRRHEQPLNLPGLGQVDGWPYWWFILVPVLTLAAAYVIMMYVRDGRSIGWGWGVFLGTCRCAVYALLLICFLMPANQTWNEVRKESRVIYLFDISDSVGTRDEIPR